MSTNDEEHEAFQDNAFEHAAGDEDARQLNEGPITAPPIYVKDASSEINPAPASDTIAPTSAVLSSDMSPSEPPPPELPERPLAERDDVPEDPQVAMLHSMFPDFDTVVLQSVLESVNGNQDRAIDMLLGMNDPSYVPQTPANPVESQTDLDEQMARRLMLEEEQAAQSRGWQRAQNNQGSAPYQPRVRNRAPRNQPQQAYDENGNPKDTMSDIHDSFNKIAESGKKTFSSIVSKVKAKIQEFDQPRQGEGSRQTSWGQGTPGEQSQAAAYSQQAAQQPYNQNPQSLNSSPSYFSPSRSVQGYDLSTPEHDHPITGSTSRPVTGSEGGAQTYIAPTSPPIPSQGSAPPAVTFSSEDTYRPPQTGNGPPANLIDRGKLGMLPRKPVSLLRPETQPPPPRRDDDDELEYTENPFEERS